MIKKLLAGQKTVNVGMAEVKIAIVITYIIFGSIMSLVSYVKSHSLRDGSPLSDIRDHIICESKGKSAECNRDIPIINSTIVVAQLVLSLFPVLSLFVTCDPQVFRSTLKSIKILAK